MQGFSGVLRSLWPTTPEWALVDVTAILAWFTFWLWLATRKLVKDTRKTAERQLRAYIGVKGLGLGPDRLDTFGIELENFGQTPALAVTVTTSRKVLPYPLDAHTFADDPDPDPPTSAVLNPRDKRPVHSTDFVPPFAEKEFEDILARKIIDGKRTALYCYGTVNFTDIFGAKRWVNYCLIFGGPFTFAATVFAYCHLHNDTSEGAKLKS